jgi:hypothetical protein
MFQCFHSVLFLPPRFLGGVQSLGRVATRRLQILLRLGQPLVGVAQPLDFLRHRRLGDGDGAPGFEDSLFSGLDVRLARLEFLHDDSEL